MGLAQSGSSAILIRRLSRRAFVPERQASLASAYSDDLTKPVKAE
jgi:hypothetical protein